MPQAADEDRELMKLWFGHPVDDSGPIKFLESRGFELTRKWTWKKPTPSYKVSDIEESCIWFLITEWDFGGYEP